MAEYKANRIDPKRAKYGHFSHAGIIKQLCPVETKEFLPNGLIINKLVGFIDFRTVHVFLLISKRLGGSR